MKNLSHEDTTIDVNIVIHSSRGDMLGRAFVRLNDSESICDQLEHHTGMKQFLGKGHKPGRLKLLWGGNQLDPDETCDDAGIETDAQLFVIVSSAIELKIYGRYGPTSRVEIFTDQIVYDQLSNYELYAGEIIDSIEVMAEVPRSEEFVQRYGPMPPSLGAVYSIGPQETCDDVGLQEGTIIKVKLVECVHAWESTGEWVEAHYSGETGLVMRCRLCGVEDITHVGMH